MKKRINWWLTSSILILSIPIGFVLTGIISKMSPEKSLNITVIPEQSNMDAVDDTIEEVIDFEPELTDSVVMEIIEPIQESKPIVEKSSPIKKVEPTPEQIAEQIRREELRLQKAEEKKLLAQQKEEERQRKLAEKQEAARKAEEERNAEQARREALKLQKAEEKKLLAQQKEEERQRKLAEKQEAERQKAEAARKAEEERKAEAARKLQIAKEQFISEVKNVIISGRSSSKIPEDCVIVVNNNQTTNYQNFRNGVKLGSYSGVRVTKVEGDGVATRVYVSAKIDAADD